MHVDLRPGVSARPCVKLVNEPRGRDTGEGRTCVAVRLHAAIKRRPPYNLHTRRDNETPPLQLAQGSHATCNLTRVGPSERVYVCRYYSSPVLSTAAAVQTDCGVRPPSVDKASVLSNRCRHNDTIVTRNMPTPARHNDNVQCPFGTTTSTRRI